MRSSVRNFLGGSLAVAALVIGSATTTLAQSQSADQTTRVDFDATRAVAPVAAVFTPKLRANFRAQQPQLGPSNEDQGIAIGVLGMVTNTSYRADELKDFYNSKTGYGVGLWVGGNRNGRVGFTGEFIYLVRKQSDVLSNDYDTKALEIPAVFHVNFGSRSRDSLGGYVVVGPVFTMILKQSVNGLENDDKFKGADVGLIGGVGVEIFRIGIEGRGNWGLRNISSEGDVSNTKVFTFELLGKFAFN